MRETADGEGSKEPYLRAWTPPVREELGVEVDPQTGTDREAEIRDDLRVDLTGEAASVEPEIRPGSLWPTAEEYARGKAGTREGVEIVRNTTPQTGSIDQSGQSENDQPAA